MHFSIIVVYRIKKKKKKYNQCADLNVQYHLRKKLEITKIVNLQKGKGLIFSFAKKILSALLCLL